MKYGVRGGGTHTKEGTLKELARGGGIWSKSWSCCEVTDLGIGCLYLHRGKIGRGTRGKGTFGDDPVKELMVVEIPRVIALAAGLEKGLDDNQNARRKKMRRLGLHWNRLHRKLWGGEEPMGAT